MAAYPLLAPAIERRTRLYSRPRPRAEPLNSEDQRHGRPAAAASSAGSTVLLLVSLPDTQRSLAALFGCAASSTISSMGISSMGEADVGDGFGSSWRGRKKFSPTKPASDQGSRPMRIFVPSTSIEAAARV